MGVISATCVRPWIKAAAVRCPAVPRSITHRACLKLAKISRNSWAVSAVSTVEGRRLSNAQRSGEADDNCLRQQEYARCLRSINRFKCLLNRFKMSFSCSAPTSLLVPTSHFNNNYTYSQCSIGRQHRVEQLTKDGDNGVAVGKAVSDRRADSCTFCCDLMDGQRCGAASFILPNEISKLAVPQCVGGAASILKAVSSPKSSV